MTLTAAPTAHVSGSSSPRRESRTRPSRSISTIVLRIYEKNPLGRVPVLEEDTFVLAESAVINEYLEDRFPEPALWPADPAERALGRMLVFRFDELSRPYYALRRGEMGAGERFDAALAELDGLLEMQPFLSGRQFGLADVAYVP